MAAPTGGAGPIVGAPPRGIAPPQGVQAPNYGSVQVGYHPDGTPYIVGVNTPGANTPLGPGALQPAQGITKWTPAQLKFFQAMADRQKFMAALHGHQPTAPQQPQQAPIPTPQGGGSAGGDGGAAAIMASATAGGGPGVDQIHAQYAQEAQKINDTYNTQLQSLQSAHGNAAAGVTQGGQQLQGQLGQIGTEGQGLNRAYNHQIAAGLKPEQQTLAGVNSSVMKDLQTAGAQTSGVAAQYAADRLALGLTANAQNNLSHRYGQLLNESITNAKQTGQNITHGSLNALAAQLAEGTTQTALARGNALTTNSENENQAVAAQQLAAYKAAASAAASAAKSAGGGGGGGGKSGGGRAISPSIFGSALKLVNQGSSDYNSIFKDAIQSPYHNERALAGQTLDALASGGSAQDALQSALGKGAHFVNQNARLMSSLYAAAAQQAQSQHQASLSNPGSALQLLGALGYNTGG